MNSFCSFQCQRTEPEGWSWGQAWSSPPWDFYMLSTHSYTVALGRLRRVSSPGYSPITLCLPPSPRAMVGGLLRAFMSRTKGRWKE